MENQKVDNKNSTRWENFNLIIDSEELDIKEKGLLLILFRYVNHGTGYANPSRALIKKLTNIKKDETLDKIFNSLLEKQFLTKYVQKGKRTKYSIKLPPKNGGTPKNGSIVPPKIGGTVPPKIGGQKEKEKKRKENIYVEIIDYLNLKANTNYRPTTDNTKKLINARLKENFTLDDFKKVIDIKVGEWINNAEMVKFIRPQTLFSNKFESYLNQKVIESNSTNDYEEEILC